MVFVVSGAGGFLGSQIIQLIDSECKVFALTSQEKCSSNNKSNIIYIKRDSFSEIPWGEVDVLINCAFPRKADGTQLAAGMNYTLNLISEAVEGGAKGIINISTQSVYDERRNEPATEDSPLKLSSTYSVSKYATELLVATICKDVPHTNLRMASLIGPRLDQRVVNKLVNQVLSGNDLLITGGKQQFGYLDVRDAAIAVISIAVRNHWDPIYNVGPTKSYSILEIAEQVQNIVHDMGMECTNTLVDETDDWQNTSIDSSRFRSQFGWSQRFGLEDTIRWIISCETGMGE